MRNPSFVECRLRYLRWGDDYRSIPNSRLFLKLESILLQQPTWRLWGEERLDGVVYTVYLKKVRYHSPSRSITTVSQCEWWHFESYMLYCLLKRMPTMEFLIWNGRPCASDL